MMSSENRLMALQLPHDPDRCEALGTTPDSTSLFLFVPWDIDEG